MYFCNRFSFCINFRIFAFLFVFLFILWTYFLYFCIFIGIFLYFFQEILFILCTSSIQLPTASYCIYSTQYNLSSMKPSLIRYDVIINFVFMFFFHLYLYEYFYVYFLAFIYVCVFVCVFFPFEFVYYCICIDSSEW